MINCCKGCQERHLACHDKCEKYLKEKEENDKANKWLRNVNAISKERAMRTGAFHFAFKRRTNGYESG